MSYLEDIINRFRTEEALNLVNHSRSDNKFIAEEQHEYDIADNEVLYRGKTNSYISLGGDRYAGKASGQGTTPQGNFAAVDIVVGSLGNKAISVINGQKVYAGKNFDKDASRIYISQRAEIDKYIGMEKIGIKVGPLRPVLEDSTGKAGIAIISDGVRIVGRNTIKLGTRHLGKDSDNKGIIRAGIDIIAGFDDIDSSGMIQPMVKGDNLIACLDDIIKKISALHKYAYKRFTAQDALIKRLAAHTHQSGAPGALTQVMSENDQFIKEIDRTASMFNNVSKSFEQEVRDISNVYFTPMKKDTYINSPWNRTN